jgi:gas vesicle protein
MKLLENNRLIINNFKDKNMSTGKVLFGLIAGFATGASLGIILAPAKGFETRKLFSRKQVDQDDPLIETFIEFLNSVSGNNKNVEKVGDELIYKVKMTIQNLGKERRGVETESGTYKS